MFYLPTFRRRCATGCRLSWRTLCCSAGGGSRRCAVARLSLVTTLLSAAVVAVTCRHHATIARGLANQSQTTGVATVNASLSSITSGWADTILWEHTTDAARVVQSWFPDFKAHANVQCNRIVNGDRSEAVKATRFVLRNRRYFTCLANDLRLANATCEELRAAGYSQSPASAAEAAFPLAFGLRMHTCAVQTELLLRTMYAPQNVYCLHIDAKAGAEVVAAMQRVAACLPNVHLAPLDDDFVYASVSQLRADLTCMRLLLSAAMAPINGSKGGASRWHYFLNMAGQELPLLTNAELVRLLRAYNGSNEIKSALKPLYRYRYRFRFWCTDSLTNRTRRCPLPRALKPPPPGGVTVYKGLAYGFFSRAFVEYATGIGKRASPAAALYNWFKDTYAPEEHFFATLARIPGAPGGYDDDGRARSTNVAQPASAVKRSAAVGDVSATAASAIIDIQKAEGGGDDLGSADAEKLEAAAAAAEAEEDAKQGPALAPAVGSARRLPTSRAVAWLGGRKRCYGRWVRQVCVYGVGDLPWIAWQPQAIANKFRYDVDPLALQCMAERVVNRTHKQRIAARINHAT